MIADATEVLRNLGFSPRESADAVARATREEPEPTALEELLRRALRLLVHARGIVTVVEPASPRHG